MKRCPHCHRAEADDALTFCRVDGTPLVRESGAVSEDAGTLKFDSAPASNETETRILPSAGAASATDEALNRPTAPTALLEAQRAASGTQELGKAKSRRGVVLTAAAIIAVALAASAYLYLSRGKNTAAIDSVAVLPFVNVGADPNMEYLSDGITESLINSLSQLPNLAVKARSTVFRYKGREADPQKVGAELNVQAVLKGRVVQRGEQLLLSLELVETRTENVIWGEQYNRKLTDLVALQSEIARDVSNKLRVRLSGADEQKLAKSHTANPEAYQLYLRGRFYWNKRSEEGLRKGIECFQQAIVNDPNFALAYVGLADSYNLLGIPDALTGAASPQETIPKARAAAERALQIDDSLAEAHASLSHIKWIDRDWAGAEEGFRHSIKLNPNYATARHWYALSLNHLGRHGEALGEIRRAQELDPLSLPINANVAFILYSAGRYEEAIGQCRKTLDMDATFALAHKRLGMVYEQKGMYREAIAEFRQAVDYSNQHPTAIAALAHALAVSGDRGESQKVLGELTKLSERRYVSPYDVAVVYAGLGDKEQAFQWLGRAVEQRDNVHRLKIESRLDSIRPDPRFAELMRKVGLPQ